jgi:hypothetical protein
MLKKVGFFHKKRGFVKKPRFLWKKISHVMTKKSTRFVFFFVYL